MATFEQTMEVAGGREAIFWWMQDYDRRLEWDPFLSVAELVDGEQAGVGVRAWCVDRAGRGMETIYVAFRAPERVAVKMTRGPWMFESFAAAWIYRAVSETRTSVTFRYHVEARPRLCPVSDWILERVFMREMRLRLEALRDAAAARAT